MGIYIFKPYPAKMINQKKALGNIYVPIFSGGKDRVFAPKSKLHLEGQFPGDGDGSQGFKEYESVEM
jgi:hypothetical protein